MIGHRFPPVLCLLGLAAAAFWGCAPAPQQSIRVATINIAHGRGAPVNSLGQVMRSRRAIERNLAAIAARLEHEAPDVVALQEADAPSAWSGDFDHVGFLADAAGFPYRFHGQHVQLDRAGVTLRYGTALLAWRPLADAQSFDFEPEWPEPRKGFVVSGIDFAGRPVLVVSVHLHSQFNEARWRQAQLLIERLEQLRALSSGPTCAGRLPGLVVMGDFNSSWDRPDDAVCFIADRLDLHAYEPGSDHWSTYPSTHPRHRIDWILISTDLDFRNYRCWPDVVSDHVGVTAELVWR